MVSFYLYIFVSKYVSLLFFPSIGSLPQLLVIAMNTTHYPPFNHIFFSKNPQHHHKYWHLGTSTHVVETGLERQITVYTGWCR